jgi:PRTRC genetic system protein D
MTYHQQSNDGTTIMSQTFHHLAVIEIGFSATKFGLHRQEPQIMPSGAAPADRVPVTLNGERVEEPLDVGGVPYLAGFERDITPHARHVAGRFAKSPDYHALFLEALHRLDCEIIETLVLGLPSVEFDDKAVKAYLKATFAGSHDIRGKSYAVRKILVADQPLGTAAIYYQDNKAALERGRMLVIDPGYGTCDIAMIVRGAVDRERSMSFDTSMRSVCTEVAKGLSSEGARVSAEWVDECFRTEDMQPILRGMRVDLHEKAKIPAEVVAKAIVANTLGRIGSFESVSNVVITGGGAYLLGEHLKNMIKGPVVEIMNKPVTANLMGFFALANGHG